jgi:hypothetical protein
MAAKTVILDEVRYTDETESSYRQWVFSVFVPFLATKKIDMAGLLEKPPRKGVVDDQDAADHEDYVALSKLWTPAEQEGNAGRKSQTTMFRNDQQCGGYLITAMQGSQLLAFVPHADRLNTQTIADANRFTALANRLMDFEDGTTVDDHVTLERYVRVDLAYVDMFIRWPLGVHPKQQAMKYFSDVQVAADRLNAICYGDTATKKVTDAELIKNAEKEMQQLERYQDNEGTNKLLKKLQADNQTFRGLWMAVVMKEKSVHFLDKATKAWSQAGGSVFSTSQGESAAGRADTSQNPCKFYQKGTCTYGKKCKFKHEGSPKSADADEAPGKNGVNRFGRAVRCYVKGCNSKDHKIGDCTHPNKQKSLKGKRSYSQSAKDRNPKKAKFAGDSAKVYTMKYIDGEWMSRESLAQPAFVGAVQEDEDTEEQPPQLKKKKKAGSKSKGGSSAGKWFAAIALCAVGIAEPQAVALSMAPLFATKRDLCMPVLHNSIFDTSLEPKVFAAQSTATKHAITVGAKFLALNDGGCQLGGIWKTKEYFYDLKTGGEYRPAKMGNGSLCKILGYGTIKLKVQTSGGVEVITLRNQAYSPDCAANIIGQADLVKQGFTFVRGKEAFIKRNSDDLRIDMAIKQGLTFWSGVPLRKTEHPHVQSLNDNSSEQFVGIVAAATSTTKLIDLLNDATLTNSTFRRTLVRKRAAELGCYISDQPKDDQLLQLHQKLGHCSIERCIDYLKRKYKHDPAQIRKKYGTIAKILCDSCDLAKVKKAVRQQRKPTPKPTRFGELSFADISGPKSTSARATAGYRFELMVVDGATGYKVLYGMKDVTHTSVVLRRHFKWLERVTGKIAQRGEERNLLYNKSSFSPGEMRLRIDNGSTFVSQAAHAMYDELGIKVERAGSAMQWQNGGVERAWASIHTRSQAMMNAAELDKSYWYFSNLHA